MAAVERRINSDGDVVHLDWDDRWVDYGGTVVPRSNVDDLEPVDGPPDGMPFATWRDLAAAPRGAIVEDCTGNLIYKTCSDAWYDEDGGVHRPADVLVWDGCWLTGKVMPDDEDDGYPGEDDDAYEEGGEF